MVASEGVQTDASKYPLAGMRVIELAQGIAGPYAGKWLAALGADVIKVEPPWGEPARAFGPWPADDPNDETSGLFLYLNPSKRGITLNLETSDGREILRELAATADVVLESFSPGYLEGHGLGAEALRESKPEQVMVSITPFGQSGPWAEAPWTELTLFALSGQMSITGYPDRAPLKNGGSQPSYQAGLNALAATVGAYYGAQVHGEGSNIDLSMRETFSSMLELYGPAFSQLGMINPRRGNHLNAVWGIYPCIDGYAGMCCLPRNYDRMAEALGLPELKEPRFADPAQRLEHEDELQAIMYGWFAGKTRAEVHALGLKYQFPAGYVATMADLLESEQLNGRDLFFEDDHPKAGRIKYPRRLWLGSEHGWVDGRAPELGQHNVDVIHGELGYEKEDLVRLRELDAI